MNDDEIRQEVKAQLAQAGVTNPTAIVTTVVSLSDSLLKQQSELPCESTTRLDEFLAIAGPAGSAVLYREVCRIRLSDSRTSGGTTSPILEEPSNAKLDWPFRRAQMVCPIPGCDSSPHFKGIIHGLLVPPASTDGPGLILESSCEGGHHWQTIFEDRNGAIFISTVRLPDLDCPLS